LPDEPMDPVTARRHFGGTPALPLRLEIRARRTALLWRQSALVARVTR